MSENEATTAIKEHKVIIIGAGMAGLSAANHLIKNGLTDFRILEARGRTGGRIVSIDLAAEKVSVYIIFVFMVDMSSVKSLALSFFFKYGCF